MGQLTQVLRQFPSAFVAVTVALTITILPSFAILNRFRVFRRIDWLSRLFISPGISIAIYVLLFSICYPLGIKLGPAVPWGICGISLASLFLQFRNAEVSHKMQGDRNYWEYLYRKFSKQFQATPLNQKLAAGLLVITCLSILASSVNMARGLVTPPGSDAIHHTLIVQLMLDHGGLFESWMPYDETSRFTYHFGFHAVTTMYAWMRGMSAEFSVLMMGQIVCALAAMGVIALMRLFSQDLWATLFSAIVAGLISDFPFVFIDWGRYTQPAGQVLLFTCLVLLVTYLKQPRSRGNFPYLLLLPIVIAGLGLAHYKVAITFAAFAVALVICEGLRRWLLHENYRELLLASLGRAAVIAGLAILLFSIRGITVLKGSNGDRISNFMTEPATENQPDTQASTIDAIAFTRMGLSDNELTFWWLACVGIAIILCEKRYAIWLLLGSVMCWFLMYPQTLGFQRAGILDIGHLRLSVYILIAVLSGLAASWLIGLIIQQKTSYQWLVTIGTAILIVEKLLSLPTVPLESNYTTPEDIQVMTWTRTNIPTDVHIATRGYAWTGGSFAFGTDGGNWLPYYTRHLTNLGNLGIATEKDPNSLAQQRSNAQFTEELYKHDMSAPTSAEWLKENGYGYFFLSSRSTAYLAERDVNLATQLLNNPSMEIFHRVGNSLLFKVKK